MKRTQAEQWAIDSAFYERIEEERFYGRVMVFGLFVFILAAGTLWQAIVGPL